MMVGTHLDRIQAEERPGRKPLSWRPPGPFHETGASIDAWQNVNARKMADRDMEDGY